MEEAVLGQGVQVASRRVRMQETDGHARQDPAGPVPYSDLSKGWCPTSGIQIINLGYWATIHSSSGRVLPSVPEALGSVSSTT